MNLNNKKKQSLSLKLEKETLIFCQIITLSQRQKRMFHKGKFFRTELQQ